MQMVLRSEISITRSRHKGEDNNRHRIAAGVKPIDLFQ